MAGKAKKGGPVVTVCYGREEAWPSREDATRHFTEGMAACDPDSSEYLRYEGIVAKLMEGADYADDEYWS